jgi:hypothetical protein
MEFTEIPPEFFILNFKKIRHGIFNQKLNIASYREFYSLNDAIHEFTKFEFS